MNKNAPPASLKEKGARLIPRAVAEPLNYIKSDSEEFVRHPYQLIGMRLMSPSSARSTMTS